MAVYLLDDAFTYAFADLRSRLGGLGGPIRR